MSTLLADNVAARWFQAITERSVEAILELAHPKLELVPTDYTAPPGTTYHGPRGLLTFADAMFERFPKLHVEPVGYREFDGGVVGLCRMLGTEPDGSAPEGINRALLLRLEGGLVRHLDVYQTEAEALESAARSAAVGFRAVFDNAVEPIFLLNDRARLVDVNRSGERLLEIDRAERLGGDLKDFVGDDRAPWDEGWSTLRKRGRATGTLEVKSSSGRRTRVSFWGTADFIPGHHLLLLRRAEPEGADPPPPLTPREREILELLAQGLTARQVAERLVLSPATVRTHVQNAVTRLEASTRVQAIAIAITRGEISP